MARWQGIKSPFRSLNSPFGLQSGVNIGEGSALGPSVDAPVEQEIVTAGVAYTVNVTSTGDTSVQLYNGNTFIGDMTGGPTSWTYSWIPTLSYNIQLRARGSDTGVGLSKTIVAAEANAISQDFSTWTQTRVGVTGGQSDPDGGSNAYLITMGNHAATTFTLAKNATVTPTEFNSGFEFWVKAGSGTVIPRLYFNGEAVNRLARFNPANDQTGGIQYSYIKKVEDGPSGWKRYWYSGVNNTVVGARDLQIGFFNDFTGLSATFTGTETIYFYKPRTADGILPFTIYQKQAARYVSTTGGVEKWNVVHEYIENKTNLSGSTGPFDIYVIKPTGWSISGDHTLLVMYPALGVSAESPTPFDLAYAADYANTYNCVIIVPYPAPLFYPGYLGRKANGDWNEHDWFVDVCLPWATEYLGATTDPERRLAVGYSKSANGLLSVRLRRPDSIGYVALWDGPFNKTFAQLVSIAQYDYPFTNEANWQLYDPLTILPNYLSSVNDRTRIVLNGYEIFQSDQVAFKAALDSYSIGYTYNATDTGDHSWNGGWLSDTLQQLFLIASPTLVAQAGSYSFTGTDATLGLIIPVLLTAEAGSYSFTGTDATLDVNGVITMPADGGSYTFTGTDATLYEVSLGPTDGILLEDGTSYRLLEDDSYRLQETQ